MTKFEGVGTMAYLSRLIRFAEVRISDLAGKIGVHYFGDFGNFAGMAQGPHKLGDGGFNGHIARGNSAGFEGLIATLISGEVGDAFFHLVGDDYRNAGFYGFLDVGNEGIVLDGNVAGAETFENETMSIAAENIFNNVGVETRENF